jgi:hypothetical protein
MRLDELLPAYDFPLNTELTPSGLIVTLDTEKVKLPCVSKGWSLMQLARKAEVSRPTNLLGYRRYQGFDCSNLARTSTPPETSLPTTGRDRSAPRAIKATTARIEPINEG